MTNSNKILECAPDPIPSKPGRNGTGEPPCAVLVSYFIDLNFASLKNVVIYSIS